MTMNSNENYVPSDAAKALWKALCMEADSHPHRTGRKPRLKPSEQLREKLRIDLGVEVNHLRANRGGATHKTSTIYLWEFGGYEIGGGQVAGGSYNTMTECIRSDSKLVWVLDAHEGEVVVEKRCRGAKP